MSVLSSKSALTTGAGSIRITAGRPSSGPRQVVRLQGILQARWLGQREELLAGRNNERWDFDASYEISHRGSWNHHLELLHFSQDEQLCHLFP